MDFEGTSQKKVFVCQIGEQLSDLCRDNGGILHVCNRLGLTIAGFRAYKKGTVKMAKKVKEGFFSEFGIRL